MTDQENAGFQAAREHARQVVQEVLATHRETPYGAEEIEALLKGMLRALPSEEPQPGEAGGDWDGCEWCGAELSNTRTRVDVYGESMWATICQVPGCGYANRISLSENDEEAAEVRLYEEAKEEHHD